MPRIPEDLSRGVAFLYKSTADADRNASSGGTCFLVAKPIEGVPADDGGMSYFIYAVTNFHVAWTANCPVIRLNRRDGKKQIIELSHSDWILHPDGDDLAATFLSDRLVDGAVNHLRYVSTRTFLKKEEVDTLSIGLGDDVFMFGRFLNHQGTEDELIVAVRFGSISADLRPVWNTSINSEQESFAVEMRSRTGFSGSPVAIYRSQMNNPWGVTGSEFNFWRLLGVNWGYIVEKGTHENTWLNGVLPAWKIFELLEVPALKDKHDQATAILKTRLADSKKAAAVPAVAGGAVEVDTHVDAGAATLPAADRCSKDDEKRDPQ